MLDCKSEFKYQNNLITHKKTHSKKDSLRESENEHETIQPCALLNNNFDKMENVNFSIGNDLPDDEFKCAYCFVKFSTDESLNVHLKSHFDGEKIFSKFGKKKKIF